MEQWITDTAYLWGILLLLPFWLLVFFTRKDLQRKLWHTGRAFGLASVVMGQLFTSDYWNPNYILGPYFPLEDFLYGLIYAGLTTVIYQYAFNVEYSSKQLPSTKRMSLLFGIISFVLLYIVIKKLHLNSIYGQIYLLIIIGIYTIIIRRDLLKPILMSAVLVTLLTFLWQYLILWIYPKGIIDNWEISILQNIYILKVPLEEILFAFSIGLGGSFFYELSNGKLLTKN